MLYNVCPSAAPDAESYIIDSIIYKIVACGKKNCFDNIQENFLMVKIMIRQAA